MTDRMATSFRGRSEVPGPLRTQAIADARVGAWPYPAGPQPRPLDVTPAGRVEPAASGTDARRWVVAAVVAVLLWSLSYLVRQPGPAVEPFSLVGDFALEGALLALAWLAMVVAACLGVLSGVVVVTVRDE